MWPRTLSATSRRDCSFISTIRIIDAYLEARESIFVDLVAQLSRELEEWRLLLIALRAVTRVKQILTAVGVCAGLHPYIFVAFGGLEVEGSAGSCARRGHHNGMTVVAL